MKQTMIRICALAAAVALAAGLTACGGAASSGSASSSPASGSASEPSSGGSALDYSKGITDEGFWEGVKALDYITLPEYKGVAIPAGEIAPSAEDIQKLKDSLVESFGEKTKITDRAVEDGDQVNIDYVGSVDGVEFSGGSTGGSGTTVTAGSTNYIDDFLTQIIGHKPGETMNVVVTFPEGYNDSTDKDGNTMVLQNKEAVFVTTINYIEGEMEYPELTDAFIAENFKADRGWSTLAELDAAVEQQVQETNKYNWLLTYLTENAAVSEVPQSIIDTMVEMNIASATGSAAQNGLDLATFLTLMGYESEDAFRTEMAAQAKETARQLLIFQAIAETEGMNVSESDLTEAFGDQSSTLAEYYGMGYLKMQMLMGKIQDFLMAQN